MAFPAPARNDGAPRPHEWLTRFPVGVVVDGVIGETVASWTTLTQDLLRVSLPDILAMNINPKREPLQPTYGPAYAIETANPDGRVKYVPHVSGSLSDTAGDSLTSAWYPLAAVDQTPALADDFATRITGVYAGHASALAYMVADDVVYASGTAAVQLGAELGRLLPSFHAIDPTRPAFGTYRTPQSGIDAYTDVADADLAIAMFSVYPANVAENGTDTQPEGDFHGYTDAYDATGNPGDFVDVIRYVTANLPTGCRVWWHAQAHQTKETGSTSPWPIGTKRYPTPGEMRLLFWQLIGEGITGIYWFTWTSATGGSVEWDGLSHPNSADRLSTATSLAVRLTSGIRQRLLRAGRTTDRFTASGGGSAGYIVNYPNAYISTLWDQASNAYYVVLANHSANTATITINGTTGFTTGTLVNLETGVSTTVGSAVSLPGFDGSIWKYVP
jgi:hypothetical protein